jgi:hypothetical protein
VGRHLAGHLVLVTIAAGVLTLTGVPLAAALPIAMVAGCFWMLLAMTMPGAGQQRAERGRHIRLRARGRVR